MDTQQRIFYQGWGQIIGLISFILMTASAGYLWWSGQTDIRYSADHPGTIPIWNIWIPALICIVLIRIIPMSISNDNPFAKYTKKQITIQSVIFLTGAILFPITLLLVDSNSPSFQLWYIGLKLSLLLIIPWIVIFFTRSQTIRSTPTRLSLWMWVSLLFIAVVWIYLSYFSLFSTPHPPSKIEDPTTLIIVLVFGFLINSLLEELFYRIWLQTRLERLLGSWPAIFVTSILWSIWHIAIQGTGQWSTDIATVISNQGITGIFLGYIWSRYRNVWVLILIHGIINAPPYLLLELWNK